MTPELYELLWLYIPLALLAGLSFAYAERRREIFRRQGIKVYRPISVIRLFYIWAVFFGIALLSGPSMYLGRLEPWSLTAGLLALAIVVVTWPPSIYVEWNSLKSERWWGAVTIPWSDVAEVTYDFHGFRTIVTSKDGKRIQHTLIDCDPEDFQYAVVTRSDHRLAVL